MNQKEFDDKLKMIMIGNGGERVITRHLIDLLVDAVRPLLPEAPKPEKPDLDKIRNDFQTFRRLIQE